MSKRNRRRVFLETSAVIYEQHGHPLMVGAVRSAVEDGVVEVSNFIRMEYVRGVAVNLIDLYFLIKREESVRDALITWSQKVNQERKLKVVLMTISGWLYALGESNDVDTTMRRLGEFIVQLVRTFDAVYKARAKDRLRCELGKVKVPKRVFSEELLLRFYERFNAIQGGPPGCDLCGFKARQQKELKRRNIDLYGAAQREVYKKNTGYVKQAERLESAAATKDTQPKCSWCERLGDSIIILHAPAKATLVTADRAFDAFGQILSHEIRRLPSLAELRKQAMALAEGGQGGEEEAAADA
jgi:hypothetical protein